MERWRRRGLGMGRCVEEVRGVGSWSVGEGCRFVCWKL